MKKSIEKAIKEYIRKNGQKLEIDGKDRYISDEAEIEYISTTTCPPYDRPKNAIAWENEYNQWKSVGESQLEGNILFDVQDRLHASRLELETTTFIYSFVEDENIKIQIKEMICSTR